MVPDIFVYKDKTCTRRDPSQGRVIAAGPGKRDERGERVPMLVEEGDRVVYGDHVGEDFTWNGKEVKILKQSDVICVMT